MCWCMSCVDRVCCLMFVLFLFDDCCFLVAGRCRFIVVVLPSFVPWSLTFVLCLLLLGALYVLLVLIVVSC